MKPVIYGIKNCDTMKKAMTWLDEHQVEYIFHDYNRDGLAEALLDTWLADVGHDVLVNRRGTTWRKLDEPTRKGIDKRSAKKLMLENPALIRRPLLESGQERVIGFSESTYASLFSK
ncbi:MAG: ArsC family reductase [Pseudomonadales bacterium]